MFDLEQAIAEWRKQMLSAGIQSPVPLEELEIHLREEIERQVKLGLNETAAFASAVQKIGPVRALQTEFSKVEGIKGLGLTGPGRIFLLICLAFALTLAILFVACPPLSKQDGEAYFSFVSYPPINLSDIFYNLELGAFGDGGCRIDVPVWWVDLLLFVGAAGTAVLAFRHPRHQVREIGGHHV